MQHDAAGDDAPHVRVAPRLPEEIHDLRELPLGTVAPRHVVERDVGPRTEVEGAGHLGQGERGGGGAPAIEEEEASDERERKQQPAKRRREQAARSPGKIGGGYGDVNAVIGEGVQQDGVVREVTYPYPPRRGACPRVRSPEPPPSLGRAQLTDKLRALFIEDDLLNASLAQQR